MPKLENFDAPGLVGFYFQSNPNNPIRESPLFTHFNIENLENYSGSDYGYVHFPTAKDDTSSGNSSSYQESEKIKYVKLPKKQICTKCGFGVRLSRNYMDLRDKYGVDKRVFSDDMCETKSVTTALYLDMNENLPEDQHNYVFILTK